MTVEGPVWAVVVAAGSGSRFGGAKQFEPLAGRPVVAWAIEAARSVADGVVLVVPPELVPRHGAAPDDGVPADRRDHGRASKAAALLPAELGADVVVGGGDSRSASVRCGLAAVPDEATVVVVHDAARPLAAPALFRAVLEALATGTEPTVDKTTEGGPAVGRDGSADGEARDDRDRHVDGAICAVPVADTLKRLDRAGTTVATTVDRAGLVAVQTPQAFRAAALRRAHRAAGDATDDAALVEAVGGVVRVVPGDPRNLKLTTPSDLDYAAHLLAAIP